MVLLVGGNTYSKEEEGRRKEKEEKKKKKEEEGEASKNVELYFTITICFQAFWTCQVQQGLEAWFEHLHRPERPRIKGLKVSIQASFFIFHLSLNLARGGMFAPMWTYHIRVPFLFLFYFNFFLKVCFFIFLILEVFIHKENVSSTTTKCGCSSLIPVQ